jgi:glycerol-3-phosphate dehydrogenase
LQSIDLLVIGGGVNGAGIARDAAGRGLSVLLVEQHDLASATSSWSSKLIHGGLRYLEYYEFRLVAESLAEREVLLDVAGHLVWPLRFVMPHVPELRPRWMIRLGLFLYDHLGRRATLPGSSAVRLDAPPYSSGPSPSCATASPTPTAAWTTRASWWRTPSMRARAARRS